MKVKNKKFEQITIKVEINWYKIKYVHTPIC